MMLALAAGCLPAARVVQPAVGGDVRFPTGEVLTYRVKFGGISAGTSTMSVLGREVAGGRDAVRITMLTRSNAFASVFYDVDDLATSIVDAESGETLSYSLEKKEKGRTEIERFSVDRGTGEIETYLRSFKGTERRLAEPAGGPVFDVVGIFYRLRSHVFKIGGTLAVTVYQKGGRSEVRMAAEAIDNVRVPGMGVFRAVRLTTPEDMPGLFSKSGKATIWLEADTHVLLRMHVATPNGVAAMNLVDAERSPLLAAHGGPVGLGRGRP